jgi:gluconate 5-dehydrogenase
MNNKSMFDLTGKVALVTGSTRGIGYAIASGFGRQGATVVLNSRNQGPLDEAMNSLAQEGIVAYGAAFDVMDREQTKSAVQDIENRVGPIAILVNNAGLQKRVPLLDCDVETWDEVIQTNLSGVFFLTQQVAKGMVARRSGKIINICSLMSEVARPTIGPYTAAKGGLKMLTRAMAVEWAPFNVQANGIGPGYFATKMNSALVENKEFSEWICRRTPAGRWGKVEELVGPAVFLASPSADFMTGQILYVDGGILAAL